MARTTHGVARAADDGAPVAAPVRHASVWSGRDMAARRDWLVELDGAAREELVSAARAFDATGAALTALTRERFVLPRLAARAQSWRAELLHGRGFVQLRGLPVSSLGRRLSAIVFWGLGQHLGDRVASQNARGELLGSVTDRGESRANADQRGPYSRETIPYHVDCCDIVGLLCLQPAARGGESSIASSGFVHNAVLAERPDLVAALRRPVYRDRRGEIPPGLAPWYAIPVFNHHAGLLSVSIEPTYIGSVSRHFDGVDPNTPAQREGVEAVQRLAAEHRLDIAFEAGDMQFVHNHTVVHSRQAYVDPPDPRQRRHLARLWLLNDDGRPLPDAYYTRHGSRETVRRPGGIVGPDTVPHASVDGLC